MWFHSGLHKEHGAPAYLDVPMDLHVQESQGSREPAPPHQDTTALELQGLYSQTGQRADERESHRSLG